MPEPLIDHRDGQPADSGESISCPIEEVQARKGLPRLSGIAGIATPFVIRDSSSGADRFVRSGESVSFELNPHGMPANAALSWYLETLDLSGRLLDDGTPLSDGSIVRLRDEQGTALVGSDTRKRVALPEASLLVLVKADVPDQTRPTTCDDQLRDGDFVLLRTLNPSAWLGATAAGDPDMKAALLVRKTTSAELGGNPECASDHESCRTDAGGGLVCVWAPACARQ